ncbi:MAG: type II toxin-antitoxin system VapC family toxin [Cytophagaceae bacterium]|nr:MAG: type II toxin-antitoxin system VapC family toxin [Cytophagaceae bacterium]
MTFTLIDSDVLIDVLRKDFIATNTLNVLLDQGPVTVSIVSRMETIRGCLNREAQQQAERLLKKLELVGLDAQIATQADKLVTAYFLSHKIAVPDALIAATALVYDLPLLSKNQRDFRFIPGLKLLPYPAAPTT